MADPLHKTKGIVLRTVKYGETSLVVSIFTELFGLQSYMVNGVRTTSKKGTSKANLYQPAALLDLVVYHNEFKNLQRIKDARWEILYLQIFTDVRKNAVSMFMIELLSKCLKQPEANPDLFYFIEDAFLHLDTCDDEVMANFPLYFSLHLAVFMGIRIDDNYNEQNRVLDLEAGNFIMAHPEHNHFLDQKPAYITSQLLKMLHPSEIASLKLNGAFRRQLLQAYETYYALHIPDFGSMKTPPVLREILS